MSMVIMKPNTEQLHAASENKLPVVFILVDEQMKGAIALADIVLPEAKAAIAALKALNTRCMMLTGDNKTTVNFYRSSFKLLIGK